MLLQLQLRLQLRLRLRERRLLLRPSLLVSCPCS
jgi:hypothetical protein